jgi:hypothetical protein
MPVKKTKSVAAKKTKAAKSPAKGKKAATKKAPVEKKSVKNANSELATLDRKTLAGKARKLKMELLAIRFNLQAPSLKEYRKKRQELASVLSHLN